MAMKIFNTFVVVADDCPASEAVTPRAKGGRETIASLQFKLLSERPYRYTLEDLIFEVHIARNAISASERKTRGAEIRAEMFSRSHACMRASPLTKSYGWGAHYDDKGRLAIIARESEDYVRLAAAKDLIVV